MRVECSHCKANLTGEAIKLLAGELKEIVCECNQLKITHIKTAE